MHQMKQKDQKNFVRQFFRDQNAMMKKNLSYVFDHNDIPDEKDFLEAVHYYTSFLIETIENAKPYLTSFPINIPINLDMKLGNSGYTFGDIHYPTPNHNDPNYPFWTTWQTYYGMQNTDGRTKFIDIREEYMARDNIVISSNMKNDPNPRLVIQRLVPFYAPAIPLHLYYSIPIRSYIYEPFMSQILQPIQQKNSNQRNRKIHRRKNRNHDDHKQ